MPIQSQPVTDVSRWRRRNWNVNLLSAIHKTTKLELPVLPSCRNWVQMDMLENKQNRLRDWRIWNHETPCSVSSTSAPNTDPGPPPNLKLVQYVFKHNEQDATLHSDIYYYKCSTCFRRFLRPSSGAQNCIQSIGYLLSFYCFLPQAVRSSKSSTNTQRCVYSFELLMTGGGTYGNM